MKEIYVNCSGCGACYLACPSNAVCIREDEKGFYRAYIDEGRCTDCGLCRKICAKCKKGEYNIAEAKHYVAVSRDKSVLEKSSSGGIAYLLSEYFIENGNKVCSVGYNDKLHNAEHFIYTAKSGLSACQGSKYLQSYNIKAFKAAMDGDGEYIIFGTPCQIAGFRAAAELKGISGRFTLVDIFCHGVPSTKLWRNHLKEINGRGTFTGSPSFRKNKRYVLKYGRYKNWYNRDGFFMLFLMNKLLNKSCYSCPYRRKSAADIRLGDLMTKKYAGLRYSPSCICVNTKKGAELLDAINNKAEYYPIDYSEIDGIQQKEKDDRHLLETMDHDILCRDDVSPKKVLGKRYYINKAKSFVKIPLILMGELFMNDTLENIIRKDEQK